MIILYNKAYCVGLVLFSVFLSLAEYPAGSYAQTVSPLLSDTARASEKGLKAQLQQETGLSFPSDMRVINYEKVSGSDLLIRSQLRISKIAFKKWILLYHLRITDFNDKQRYLLGPDRGWWDPHTPHTLPTAQVMFENGTVLNLAYREENKGSTIVYLLFHGT